MAGDIPVKIRTARKSHVCAQCGKWIEPGERYEDHRLPPNSELGNGQWWPLKTHIGAYPIGRGCVEAAAYRENAARQAAAEAVTAR